MPNLQRTHRLTVPSSVSSTIAAQSHKRLDSQPTIRDKPATIALHTLAQAGTSLLPTDEPLELDEVDSIVAILAVSGSTGVYFRSRVAKYDPDFSFCIAIAVRQSSLCWMSLSSEPSSLTIPRNIYI